MLIAPKTGLVLFLLGIALPLLEIAVMIKVAGSIGVPLTLLLIFVTAALGMFVLRDHGFMIMRRMSETVAKGGTPLAPMIEGGLLFLAGWLLISPGFICDTIGLALLVAPIRHGMAAWIRESLWPGLSTQTAGPDATGRAQGPFASDERFDPRRPGGPQGPADRGRARHDQGPIIEGEFERIDERDVPRSRSSGSGGKSPPRSE